MYKPSADMVSFLSNLVLSMTDFNCWKNEDLHYCNIGGYIGDSVVRPFFQLGASRCREHSTDVLSAGAISMLAEAYIAWPVTGCSMGSAKAFKAVSTPSLLASALRRLPESCTRLSEATADDGAVQSGIA